MLRCIRRFFGPALPRERAEMCVLSDTLFLQSSTEKAFRLAGKAGRAYDILSLDVKPGFQKFAARMEATS